MLILLENSIQYKQWRPLSRNSTQTWVTFNLRLPYKSCSFLCSTAVTIREYRWHFHGYVISMISLIWETPYHYLPMITNYKLCIKHCWRFIILSNMGFNSDNGEIHLGSVISTWNKIHYFKTAVLTANYLWQILTFYLF